MGKLRNIKIAGSIKSGGTNKISGEISSWHT